jgi:hypothetical protein
VTIDLDEAIHRATFGYTLTRRQGTALLEALLKARARVSVLSVELDGARREIDAQRALVERLTNDVMGAQEGAK